MARVQFGGGISQMRGSIAGTVFSRNANGAYTRSRTAPANPNSPKQVIQRNSFGAISRLWRGLTVEQRQSFIDQAVNYPYVNSVGESSVLTGFQLFQQVNSRLISGNQSTIDTMPAPIEMPGIDSFTNSVNSLAGDLAAGFSSAGSGNVPADCFALMEATIPMSAGKYRPKRPDFKLIKVFEAGDSVNAEDVSGNYTGVFGPRVLGNVFFMRLTLVNQLTGQRSNPVWYRTVTTA